MSSKKFRLAKEKKKEVYIPESIYAAGTAPIEIFLLVILGDALALICYDQNLLLIDKIFIGFAVLMSISAIFILFSKIYVAIAKAVEKRINKPHKA
jgi:hypothetical protein